MSKILRVFCSWRTTFDKKHYLAHMRKRLPMYGSIHGEKKDKGKLSLYSRVYTTQTSPGTAQVFKTLVLAHASVDAKNLDSA